MLVDSLYEYTYAVMTTLRDAGAMPNMVQLGNEINSGMLWPDGNVWPNDTPAQWKKLGQLLNAGVQAVRESEAPGDTVKIMIHHADGSRWFFGNLLDQSVPVDYFGRSYYPQWHGTFDELTDNLEDLATQFDQKVVVVEAGYCWTLDWADNRGNVLGSSNTLSGYPVSPEGQRAFLIRLRNIVQTLPNGKGNGVFYWEPAWLPDNIYGSPMENANLFDFEGNALNSIDALATDITQLPASNLTLRINTSTVWDTLNTEDLVQLRGEVKGYTGVYLSDGRKVSWGDDSRLFAENVGGDYWEITIPLIVGDTLSYKFWTGFTLWNPTAQRLGWEGPVTPGGGLAGNTRMVVAAEMDTTFPLEFVNGSGTTVMQYWRPYELHEDSVVISYRVNMESVMLSGLFDPDIFDRAGVMGNSPLPVDGTVMPLDQEIYSVANGSFWSGTARLSRSALTDGHTHNYRFVILREGGGAQAENVERSITLNESFEVPDTTLYWVWFNDREELSVEEELYTTSRSFSLLSLYPNPFNSEVRLSFELLERSEIEIAVFNLVGQRVRTLTEGLWSAGSHDLTWDGCDHEGNRLPSGTYMVQLRNTEEAQRRKVILVR